VGHEFPIVASTKQKLNTWSSTESDSWSRRFYAGYMLDLLLHGIPGLYSQQQHCIPGQQELHPSREKRESFEQQTHQAYQHSLFFHH
jgi:hypothetical protein